jgi:excisionase family DNA binding protein
VLQHMENLECLSMEEAAKLLSVHHATLRRAIDRGDIRRIKLGDRVLIPRQELARFIETQINKGR